MLKKLLVYFVFLLVELFIAFVGFWVFIATANVSLIFFQMDTSSITISLVVSGVFMILSSELAWIFCKRWYRSVTEKASDMMWKPSVNNAPQTK